MAQGDVTVNISKPLHKGLKFDSTASDYIDCGNNASLIQNKIITLEAWVKPTNLVGSKDIVSHYKTVGNQRGFQLQLTGDKVRFAISEDGGFANVNEIVSAITISTGWNHILSIWDGTLMYQYINGVLDSNTQAATLMYSATNEVRIGAYESGNYFNGTIDGVKIYDRGLSATEILRAYRGKYVHTKGLVGHWSFNNTADPGHDDSGNGNNGTLHGTTCVGDHDTTEDDATSARVTANDKYYFIPTANDCEIMTVHIEEA